MSFLLSLRQSTSSGIGLPDFLLLISLAVALMFRINAGGFAFWSIQFDRPIDFITFWDLDVRLFHLLGLFILIRALYQSIKKYKLRFIRHYLGVGLWASGVAVFGLLPFAELGPLEVIESTPYHIEITLATLVGFAVLQHDVRGGVRSFIREAALALTTSFVYWFALVAVFPPEWSESLEIRRTHFLFPIGDTHLGTGFYVITIMIMIMIFAFSRDRQISTLNLSLVFILSLAIGLSSSRGAALVLLTLSAGLVLSALISRNSRNLWKPGGLILGGLLGSIAVTSSLTRTTRVLGNWFSDLEANPVLEDTRLTLLGQGVSHLEAIWTSSRIGEVLFGIGYNQTRARFGVPLDSHNDVITALIERGLLGFALLSVPMFLLIGQLLQQSRHQELVFVTILIAIFELFMVSLTALGTHIFFLIGIIFFLEASRRRGLSDSS